MLQDIREDEMSTENVPSANHSSPPLLSLAHTDDINMKGSSRNSLSLRLSIRISFKRANYFIFNEEQVLAISRRTTKGKKISTELSLPFNIKRTLLVQTKKSMKSYILSGSG